MKVYFAGPDIFRLDYPLIVERIKDLSAKHGITPLIPGNGSTTLKDPREIFHDNIKLLKEADGVIANLNKFRSYI
jgi:nucleoside 2-deoxyribosyltransferase